MKQDQSFSNLGNSNARPTPGPGRWIVSGAFCLLIFGAVGSLFLSSGNKRQDSLPVAQPTQTPTRTPAPKPSPTPKPTPTPTPAPKLLTSVKRRVHRQVEAGVGEAARLKAKAQVTSINGLKPDEENKIADAALAETYARYAGGPVAPSIYSGEARRKASAGVKQGNSDGVSRVLGEEVNKIDVARSKSKPGATPGPTKANPNSAPPSGDMEKTKKPGQNALSR